VGTASDRAEIKFSAGDKVRVDGVLDGYAAKIQKVRVEGGVALYTVFRLIGTVEKDVEESRLTLRREEV
jgi:transcription antitermination factor NusG